MNESDLAKLATKEDLGKLATKEEIKAMIAEVKVDLLKWAIGVQLSFAAIILGAVYAMLTHWKP
jgi:hypothetical protein